MRRFLITRLVAVLFFLAVSSVVSQTDGRVTHIVSHNKVKVVTDPSTGSHPYPQWTIFPPPSVDYRKVVLYVTYQCPDSLHCGEWDYIDGIYLRRVGGADAPARNIEIGRMISPYGGRFGATWRFTWHVDITDFAFLLHDSVEVEFNHGGYESNTDRGWLVTLDFELTEGRPAMTCLGMDTLWHGAFPYGDSSKPIEALLRPISFTAKSTAGLVRLRILQTGHGMDDSENCSEFCNKYRRVLLDDSVVDQRQIWRRCGTNPLYPQAGTWLFDRANWCPGSIVQPDLYDFAVAPGSTHTIDIEMEPYINSKTPTANYYIYAYLFHYTAPWATNDVSLQEVIVPSTTDENDRLNPACSSPRIVIKNSGRDPLASVMVRYGAGGTTDEIFQWEGHLPSQQTADITLPGAIMTDSTQHFEVVLETPNGADDEYPADNRYVSQALALPVYGTQCVLALLTNRDSSHNSYQLINQNGTVVKERAMGSLLASTLYKDTFRLAPGCYQLIIIDTAGDGLDFWFNAEGGYGYARLLDMEGRLLKSFGSDFGSEIRYAFSVVEGAHPRIATDELPLVNPFPVRNKGTFTVEIFFNESHAVDIGVTTEDSTRTVFQKTFEDVKEAMIPIDISVEPDGVYWVKVLADGKTTTRKIKVKHQD